MAAAVVWLKATGLGRRIADVTAAASHSCRSRSSADDQAGEVQ